MGTLLSFLRYSEVYEGHRISALAWAKLSRNIEIELSLHHKKRKPCRDFLKVMRAEYDNLMESSPSIDLDVIQMFNKKFDGKYENVRKPIIVYGLRDIKSFKSGEKFDVMQKSPDLKKIEASKGQQDRLPGSRRPNPKYRQSSQQHQHK